MAWWTRCGRVGIIRRVQRELIDIAEARARVLAAVEPLPPEEVALEAALGRILRQDVHGVEDLPPFDASAMDGYAVVAGPAAELPVVGESRAGAPAGAPLGIGQAMRISTGAAMPRGADAVVPVERTEAVDGRVRLPDTTPGANVRRAGEDVRSGELVLAAGTEIGPAELGVLASIGLARVACGPRPRVAVVTTGDELVEPGQRLRPGQIRNSNAIALSAQAVDAGAESVARAVPDDLEATTAALGDALEAADVVCVAGGVSVGEHDHVKAAFAELGVEERFWGVRLKPGKPTWFGTRGSTLAFGLPGNPVSAMVTFHLFSRPALRVLAGADPGASRTTGVLDVPVKLSSAREQVLRCRLEARADGWHVAPTKRQESHVLTSMLGAGAFALVPAGEGELAEGERVEIELLGRG